MPNSLELTAAVVVAYVENNRLAGEDLPDLIRSVHSALEESANGVSQEPPQDVDKPTPAQVRRSITPDAIMSFEDGRPYKSMKRHLTRLGLTPAQYREKWGLRPDYPMVAPNYSAARSALAKASGLGAQRRKPKAGPKASKARGGRGA